MKIFYLILLCFLSFRSAAQVTFQKVFKPNTNGVVLASTVQPTADGGYIVLGTINNYLYLVKTDSLGTPSWKRMVTLCNTFCYITNSYSVIQTKDGGFMVVGAKDESSGGSNMYFFSNILLYKFDSNGSSVWYKDLKNTFMPVYCFGYSIRQTFDNGFIIGGANSLAGILVKTDSLGNLVWKKEYAGLGPLVAAIETRDSNIVSVGVKNVSAGNNDIQLIKTNAAGVSIWAKSYDNSGDDIPKSVILLPDGGYLVSGSAKDASSNYDAFVLRTDSLGSLIWSKKYGGQGLENGNASLTRDGGFILAGVTNSAGNDTNAYLIKIDSLGNIEWSKTYGHVGSEGLGNVVQTNDGGYIAAGYTNSFGNGIYLVKTDSLGNTGCYQAAFSFPISIPSTSVAHSVPASSNINLVSNSSYYLPAVSTGIVMALCPSCTSTQIPVIAGGSAPFCPGTSVSLTSSLGVSYLWSSTASTQSISVATAGSFTVTVTDTSGCTATSAPVITSVFPPSIPLITVSGSTFTATLAVAYQWYLNGFPIPGAANQTYTATANGNYQVETYDSNGCFTKSAPYSFLLDIGDIELGIIEIYPNPSPGNFAVSVTERGHLVISDTHGRQVLTRQLKAGLNSLSMPANTPSGIYIVRFVASESPLESYQRFQYYP